MRLAALLRPLQHDAGRGLDAGQLDGFVEQRLVQHKAAGLEPAACREDQFWFGILDPGGEFFRGKAAEHHGMHRADPRAGQHRHHGFRHHRHIEDDAVAFCHAEILHDGGKGFHLVQHLGIGEFGDSACSGRICQRRIVDQRHLIGAAVRDMAVERVVAGVDDGAGEPAAVKPHGGIEHFLRGLNPVDLARRLAPKTLGIPKRAGMDLVVPAAVLDVHGVAPARLVLAVAFSEQGWMTDLSLAMTRIKLSRFSRALSRDDPTIQDENAATSGCCDVRLMNRCAG